MSVPIVSANYQYVALSLATEEASTFHNIYWLYCNAPLNVELPHQIKYEAINTIKLSLWRGNENEEDNDYRISSPINISL
ncbi:MAG: hypothetical protein HRU38_01820 [Saccharospirillaceae bacterium]|nr:hypothetical protein [Colwellia sp.]NRB77396.1 hypothetical protein [Saccharospirillaceae bacterium]